MQVQTNTYTCTHTHTHTHDTVKWIPKVEGEGGLASASTMGARSWSGRRPSWSKVFEDNGLNCRIHGAAAGRRRVDFSPLSNSKVSRAKHDSALRALLFQSLSSLHIHCNHFPANSFAFVGSLCIHSEYVPVARLTAPFALSTIHRHIQLVVIYMYMCIFLLVHVLWCLHTPMSDVFIWPSTFNHYCVMPNTARCVLC